jgi:hypothetical protein
LRPRDAFTDESGVNLTGRARALEENGSRKLNRALRFAVGPLGNDATGLAKRPSTKPEAARRVQIFSSSGSVTGDRNGIRWITQPRLTSRPAFIPNGFGETAKSPFSS